MRESRVHASDLILPVFVLDGKDLAQDVPSMPGVQRVTLDRLYPIAEECVRLGIPVMALFPVLEQSLKSQDGREALNEKGLIPRIVGELKKRCSTTAATSSTTRRSRCWCGRRWCRPRPASTSSRRAT